MKIQLHSLITVQVDNPIGRVVFRSLTLFLRCLVLSLFIWVAAHNAGRAYQGEQAITLLAKGLAYPVYLVEKPLLRISYKFDCLRTVPEQFGFLPHTVFLYQIVPPELSGPWKPDGIWVNGTPFFNRGFTCNLAFIALFYFCLFSGSKLIALRVRPNPPLKSDPA